MLELKNVYFSSDDSHREILSDISLNFAESSLNVITGPNGSGKSTLAETIMGIKVPTNGQIYLNGKDVANKTIVDRAKLGIAFSFQQPVKFKGINVYDLLNIARGELISEEQASDYLKTVGLEPEKYLFREVDGKLSGGELKRIEIASVLARDAELLIFDEPEAGIDLWSFEDLTKIFKRLKSQHKTLIIISHQERIFKIADKIIVLESGKIKYSGSPKAILPKIKGEKR